MTLSPAERAGVTAWLLGEPPALSPAWIASQRWFGGKARSIDRLAVADVVWIGADAATCAFLIVDVHYHGDALRGEPVERYALLVGIGDNAAASIGRLPWPPALDVVEVATDPDSIRTVVATVLAGNSLPGARGGELNPGDRSEAAGRDLATGQQRPLPVNPLGFEQSNTSVRVGTGYVLKVIRRLQEGENPQLEIGRFLARVGFPFAPPLHGSLTYRDARGANHALVALEGWVDNEGDGWRYVLDSLEHGALAVLRDQIRLLGAITAQFHVALASDPGSGAFRPEAVSADDARQWRDAVQVRAARLLQIVEHDQAHWPPAAAALGRALLERRDELAARLGALDLTRDLAALRKIRVHGDFHLGQTLKTANGFALIDFEGEPARPLAERRQKHCALKDVAGLLRSLDYAEATVSRRAPAAAGAAATLRHAFLDGYYAEPDLDAFLPGAREDSRPLLALFELEKALYEVEYELNNRPEWLHIPLAAVVRAVDAPR